MKARYKNEYESKILTVYLVIDIGRREQKGPRGRYVHTRVVQPIHIEKSTSSHFRTGVT